jgi:hypothetical protein
MIFAPHFEKLTIRNTKYHVENLRNNWKKSDGWQQRIAL